MPDVKLSADLIRRYGRKRTGQVGHLKGLVDGDLTSVKQGVCCGRFLFLAFSASLGKCCFSFTTVGVAAFRANESSAPLQLRQQVKATVLIRENTLELHQVLFGQVYR